MIKKEMVFKVIVFMCIFSLMLLNYFCNRQLSEDTFRKTDEYVELGINIKKIEESTGISFEIIKIKDIGYDPLNMFFWVNLDKKISGEQLKSLSQAIIEAVIKNKPKTYHSFTLHYISIDKDKESEENPEAFATVTFLPEGNWAMVGRVPIDDYSDYVLTYTSKDNMLE